MLNALIVFLGGGAGALARHFMAIAVRSHTQSSTFPYPTLCINLLGALLIGMIVEILALRINLPQEIRLLLVTGFLGGFTTFSAFSLESALMIQRGDYMSCGVYIAASVIGTILLVFVGTFGVRNLLQ